MGITTIAEHLLATAAGRRHGIVLPPAVVPVVPADLPSFINVAVPVLVDEPSGPASGGIAKDQDTATRAAIGEALERYAASLIPLPTRTRDELTTETVLSLEDFGLFSAEQLRDAAFPFRAAYDADPRYTDAYSLVDNRAWWVPVNLISLDRKQQSVATSSGVACASDPSFALLRALQELIERDALMTTWLHEVPGRRIELAPDMHAPVASRAGDVVAFDATPSFSPHPVAIVMGMLPYRGRPRFSLGAACRETWDGAVSKAYAEWAQGITFVGDRMTRGMLPESIDADDVRDFDQHALYYSLHANAWPKLPIFGDPTVHPAPSPSPALDAVEALRSLVFALDAAAIRLFYRDVTTIDLRQIGAHVVRVLSPDLTPVHHDHRFPHLGGNGSDVQKRYPWHTTSTPYPSRHPHPLG